MKKVCLLTLIATTLLLTGCGGVSSSITPPNSSGNSQNQNSNGSNENGSNGSGTAPHVDIPRYVDPGIKNKIKPSNVPHPNKKYSKVPIKPRIPPLPPKI